MELITISTEVVQQIKQILEESKVKSTTIRIICVDQEHDSYGLQLDRITETDMVEEHQGIQFIVSRDFYTALGGFTIVSIEADGEIYLQIRPYKESKSGEGADCSSCSSCSSCG